MWWKFVQSAPSAYANSLAEMTWKGQEKPRVDESANQLWQYEERLSSSLWACISAVHQLSQEAQELQENACSPYLLKPIRKLPGIYVPLLKRIEWLHTMFQDVVLPWRGQEKMGWKIYPHPRGRDT